MTNHSRVSTGLLANTWLVLFCLFFAALIVQGLFISFVPVNPKESGDQGEALETAWNILREGVPHSSSGYAYRPPVYPYFLAAIIGLGGRVPESIYWAQALLGAGSVVLLFLLLRDMDPRVALARRYSWR